MVEKMKVLRIITERLEKAEADLKSCPRGANHGRVNELKEIFADVWALAEIGGDEAG